MSAINIIPYYNELFNKQKDFRLKNLRSLHGKSIDVLSRVSWNPLYI